MPIQILDTSNPDDLQEQLAEFLKKQQEAEEQKNQQAADASVLMPEIKGRNIASNNLTNTGRKKGIKEFLSPDQKQLIDEAKSGKKKQKPGGGEFPKKDDDQKSLPLDPPKEP